MIFKQMLNKAKKMDIKDTNDEESKGGKNGEYGQNYKGKQEVLK